MNLREHFEKEKKIPFHDWYLESKYIEWLENKVKEISKCLKSFVNLDLVGINSNIVYQRNRTKIMLNDILKAKKILNDIGGINENKRND